MSMHNVFRQRLPRHKHNLSERQYFDMNMGQLIPTYVKELYPGDTVKISSSALLETRTLKAPLKNNIKYREYWFFVPRRLMWKNWEKFIFGGKDGNFTASFPFVDFPNNSSPITQDVANKLNYNSLFNYLGFPSLNLTTSNTNADVHAALDKFKIDAMPFAAYQMIYKDWFRNENFSSDSWDFENTGSAWLSDGGNTSFFNPDTGNLVGLLFDLRNVPWSRTYFTGALPFRQRGNANRVPLHGVAPLHSVSKDSNGNWILGGLARQYPLSDSNGATFVVPGTGNTSLARNSQVITGVSSPEELGNTVGVSGIGAISGADLQGFTITELRLLAKLQEFEEINARFGFRYIEGLQGHFGVSPTDARLDRPEFIGGRSQDVIISEILQTSETGTTPLGTPGGRGISGSGNRIAKYFAEEHGILMCVCSIMPEQIYSQGIDRQWTRRTKEEFFSPEFNGLSEQEVKEKEIYAVSSMTQTQLDSVFGFVPAWEELRHGKTMVKGNLANPNAQDLFAWTQARFFSSAPVLGENFLMANQNNSNGGVRTDAWTTLNASCPFFASMHFKVTKISTLSASGVPGITRI